MVVSGPHSVRFGVAPHISLLRRSVLARHGRRAECGDRGVPEDRSAAEEHSRHRTFADAPACPQFADTRTKSGVIHEQRTLIHERSICAGLRGLSRRMAGTADHPSGFDSRRRVYLRWVAIPVNTGIAALSFPAYRALPTFGVGISVDKCIARAFAVSVFEGRRGIARRILREPSRSGRKTLSWRPRGIVQPCRLLLSLPVRMARLSRRELAQGGTSAIHGGDTHHCMPRLRPTRPSRCPFGR